MIDEEGSKIKLKGEKVIELIRSDFVNSYTGKHTRVWLFENGQKTEDVFWKEMNSNPFQTVGEYVLQTHGATFDISSLTPEVVAKIAELNSLVGEAKQAVGQRSLSEVKRIMDALTAACKGFGLK